jgi:farnesol dehydrogenase
MADPGRCYLVTGGTGFIGRRLVALLTHQGHKAHVLSRDPAKKTLFSSPLVHFFTGDITAREALRQAMKGCHGVFHLAAYAKGWAPDEQPYYKYNVTGTENVLLTARETGAGRIVFCSTAGVINPSSDIPADENTPRTVPFFTAYERSKNQAEQLVKEHVGQGSDVVIVNPSRVFGPGPLVESNSVTKIIDLFRRGKWHIIPGNGKSYGNYVYVDDVAEGMLLAMERGRTGERYILGGENLTYLDLFEHLRKATGRKPFLLPLPLFLMLSLSRLMMAGHTLFGLRPLITPDWVKRYMYNWKLSTAKAERELAYRPHTFTTALEKTLSYLSEQS